MGYSNIATISKEEKSALAADDEIAAKFRIKNGEPVLFHKRFVYDQGQRPREYNLGYY